jgi:8-oxo-dGTP pyrophosphatase MutT (NUDIX family)
MALSEYYAKIRQQIGHSLILVPGVAAIIRDEIGQILLQRKPDATWSLPAGAIEPGETPAPACLVAQVFGINIRTAMKWSIQWFYSSVRQ